MTQTATLTLTLTDFLLARIAEDEEAAREANGRVAWLTLRYPNGSMRYTTVGHQHHAAEPFWFADGHGIDAQDVYVFYDSARVLAECAAKRRIVTASVDVESERGPLAFYDDDAARAIAWALRALALPYADHPDFREEWRA